MTRYVTSLLQIELLSGKTGASDAEQDDAARGNKSFKGMWRKAFRSLKSKERHTAVTSSTE